MTGIEPAFTAWEAVVLPMNYIRTNIVAEPADKSREKVEDYVLNLFRIQGNDTSVA